MITQEKKPSPRVFNLRNIVGFAISGLLLWFTFYQSGLKLTDIKLVGIEWAYFAIAMLMFLLCIWVQSQRARILWSGYQREFIKADTFSGFIVGNFYNCVLPGNLGDGVRAYHFSKKYKVSFLNSLSCLITEKWIDAQLFIVLTVILWILKPFSQHLITYTLVSMSILILLMILLYKLMRNNRPLEKKIWKMAITVLRKLGKYLFKLYLYASQHIDNLKRKKLLMRYLTTCFITFSLNILQFYFLLHAAGISDPARDIYTSVLIATSMMIIAFIPSAPSNIGVLHYGVYLVLIYSVKQYGIEPNQQQLEGFALFGIYMHLTYFIPEILMGIIFVIKERQKLFSV